MITPCQLAASERSSAGEACRVPSYFSKLFGRSAHLRRRPVTRSPWLPCLLASLTTASWTVDGDGVMTVSMYHEEGAALHLQLYPASQRSEPTSPHQAPRRLLQPCNKKAALLSVPSQY